MPGTIGNKNSTAEKRLFTAALRRRYIQNPDKLARLIDSLCTKAESDGDLASAKEIMDRVDGRSVQATEISGADGAALFRQSSDEELDARIIQLAKKLPLTK